VRREEGGGGAAGDFAVESLIFAAEREFRGAPFGIEIFVLGVLEWQACRGYSCPWSLEGFMMTV
jgi:hypothetical protein